MKAISSGRSLKILAHALADLRVLLRQLPFENGHRAEGQQPDHRAHLQAFAPPVRQAQHIVKEAVLLIPHPDFLARSNHPRSDQEKVPEEFLGEIDISRISHRQLGADLEHVLAEERHPGGAIGLFQVAAGRQRRRAVEDPDIVQPQESPFEGIVSGTIFAVDPPGEVKQQLVETALEPGQVSLPALRFLQQVGEDR